MSHLMMERLQDSDLSRSPADVFEILCKLGKGSYGSVFKARYKATGGIVAVKKVPVDSDLTDIVKEISIMQQCDSPFIVKCYGSLFDSQDLWICMEYCGAGSIADIMRLRGKTLSEEDIATVLHYSLRGLDYLHQMRKIHRDIKAGNILLLNSGMAKLADFGVAGQLSDTLAKRNTVIGTPYWMAPEVIQEIGYNYSADIWSLGITAIEMADGKPPLADIHPMRALFMIPSQPSPALRKPPIWTAEFRSFIAACLAKTPEARPTAAALLQTEFIRNAKPSTILLPLIEEARVAREKRLADSKAALLAASQLAAEGKMMGVGQESTSAAAGRGQVVQRGDGAVKSEDGDEGNETMVRQQTGRPTWKDTGEVTGTLVSLKNADTGSPIDEDDDLGTMVINPSEDEDEPDDGGSVVVHNTEEQKRREAMDQLDAAIPGAEGTLTRRPTDLANQQQGRAQNEPSDAGPPGGVQRPFAPVSRVMQQSGLFPAGLTNEPGALNRLNYGELQQLLATLNVDLEAELRNLAVRYKHKRQPLLDAIAEKTAQVTEAKLLQTTG